jgi:hypothetical protein
VFVVTVGNVASGAACIIGVPSPTVIELYPGELRIWKKLRDEPLMFVMAHAAAPVLKSSFKISTLDAVAVAVKDAVLPGHTAADVGVMVGVEGGVFTVTFALPSVPQQPAAERALK